MCRALWEIAVDFCMWSKFLRNSKAIFNWIDSTQWIINRYVSSKFGTNFRERSSTDHGINRLLFRLNYPQRSHFCVSPLNVSNYHDVDNGEKTLPKSPMQSCDKRKTKHTGLCGVWPCAGKPIDNRRKLIKIHIEKAPFCLHFLFRFSSFLVRTLHRFLRKIGKRIMRIINIYFAHRKTEYAMEWEPERDKNKRWTP